jgi:hypothetical protein
MIQRTFFARAMPRPCRFLILMLRYQSRDDNPPVMRVTAAARSNVVPAKAGTHTA